MIELTSLAAVARSERAWEGEAAPRIAVEVEHGVALRIPLSA
jgi:hypothetical protein